jgi:nucleoside-diphosphate-sugar epimerase
VTKSRVMVTGGAGFIGSHLVEALSRRHSVVVLDNFSTGKLRNLSAVKSSSVRIVRGDIGDRRMVARVLRGARTVFHQAARVGVTPSVANPILTNDVNVNGTLNLLKAAVKNHVERFIFASSASVYAERPALPKREDMVPEPISPYGVSKLAAENYCKTFYKTYGLETVSLRYFNVYGPRQTIGPYSGVITTFTDRIKKGKQPIVFGDGSQIRDFTFVSDVVQANLLAMENDAAAGEIFNIGTGIPTSINTLAKTILRLCGRPRLGISRQEKRPGEVVHSLGDISRARRVLGYRPKVRLDDGLRLVIGSLNE